MSLFHALRADQIQPPDDPARRYAERGQAGIARAIRDAITALAETIHGPTVERLITSNDFKTLWRHLALERLTPALRPALNRLAMVHDQSAVHATAGIGASPVIDVAKARPSFLRTPDVINLTYDPLNTATVAAQNTANDAVAASVQRATQASADQIVTSGLAQRQSPAVIARNLRDTLSLTTQEANAVQNYRRLLESGNASSISRALRDPRYDAAIRRGSMTMDQIDRATARYADRYRAFRADRIARTEALRAANAGRAAAWRQYADRTGRDSGDIRKFWLTAGDELVCPVCRAIPSMNPDGVPFDGDYESPIGMIAMPPDPHPNCRCTERYERVGTASEKPAAGPGVGLRIELDYGPNG